MTSALLTAVDSSRHVHLIIGFNSIAAARCTRSVEVCAKPILITPEESQLHYGLLRGIEKGELEWLKRDFRDKDLTSLGRNEVDHVVDAVFITLGANYKLSSHISTLCRRLRIPINVVDAPHLCTFTLLCTHTDGPLQIGITTSHKGCKLASRIRREVAASLPQDIGAAVDRLGTIRRRIWEEDRNKADLSVSSLNPEHEDDDSGQSSTFNGLVSTEEVEVTRTRRMRWLAQICEHWPLRRLASITEADVDSLLKDYRGSENGNRLDPSVLDARAKNGRIILAGSGPGNPNLLTTATLEALRNADLILADKLVPSGVLDLIPRRTQTHIARKFPGNAHHAQEELQQLGLEGIQAGKLVVRLKQGDPYLYGRGAEEFEFFRERGYTPVVLPGLTSALTAPLFAAIPVTHRGVADQVLICTGTGQKGVAPPPPSFVPNRTVIFLMALHRIGELVASLVAVDNNNSAYSASQPESFSYWPPDTSCAIVERSSCPDQRVIRSSLENIFEAVLELGSRPPGLLIVGGSCLVLNPRVEKWSVEEGCSPLDFMVGGGVEKHCSQESQSISLRHWDDTHHS